MGDGTTRGASACPSLSVPREPKANRKALLCVPDTKRGAERRGDVGEGGEEMDTCCPGCRAAWDPEPVRLGAGGPEGGPWRQGSGVSAVTLRVKAVNLGFLLFFSEFNTRPKASGK